MTYFYRYFHDVFPIVLGTQVVGCVSKRHVAAVPHSQWSHTTVADIMGSCSPGNTMQAESNTRQALAHMTKTASSRLLVPEGDKLVGMIVLKDLSKHLAFRLDLGRMYKAA